jgi:hypothetical protein
MKKLKKIIDKEYLPQKNEEYVQFLEALYEFILNIDDSLSVQENLQKRLDYYHKILNEEIDNSFYGLGATDRQVDFKNEVFNTQKSFLFIVSNLQTYESFLNRILQDKVYRKELHICLDHELYEEPGFFTRLWDTYFRMGGNRLGWYRGK